MTPSLGFSWGRRTYLMGIVNATPDSFSGDGLYASGRSEDALQARLAKTVQAGADVLDVGAESTRPGAEPVAPEAQIERLEAVLGALAQLDHGIPISIDTCSAAVADYAIDHGATIINDVSGFRRDPEILEVAAARGSYVVATHATTAGSQLIFDPTLGGGYRTSGTDLTVDRVCTDLVELAGQAISAGVAADRVIVDPGIGFGKGTAQNVALAANLGALRRLGYPVLYGPSRKRFIGDLTGRPPGERLAGTCATLALAVNHGVDLVRAHDIEAAADVLAVANRLVHGADSGD